VTWTANATGVRLLSFERVTSPGHANIAEDVRQAASGGAETGQTISAIDRFAAGECLGLHVFQTSGGALNIEAFGGYPEVARSASLSATWLAP
jgi:hypothetical protein